MKFGWALLVVSACGGGGGSGGDGGVSDMSLDDAAEIDGGTPDADPSLDTDGDGVVDLVDVCPTVADPAQVDLDGDGIGWMCDAVESTEMPRPPDLAWMAFAARGHTMGLQLTSQCTNVGGVIDCAHSSLVVGPGGVSRADDQMDPWLEGRTERGFVNGENRVLWSMANGVIGDQDAATDMFTQRHTGGVVGFTADGVARFERGPMLVLSSDAAGSSSYELLEPHANGDVSVIATSSMELVKPTLVGTNPPKLVFGTSPAGSRGVYEFVPGMATSQPIMVGGVPLSNADVVQWMTRPILGGMFGFCVELGGKRYIVEVIDQMRAYEVPAGSCALSAQQTNDHRLTLFTADVGFFVLDGTLHAMPFVGSELFGTGLPAVITRRVGSDYEAYIVDATGTLHQVTGSLGVSSNVSRAGDTLHFVSYQGGANFNLVRFRNGTITSVPLPPVPGEQWDVFTTKEGAALTSTDTAAVVWPSQSAAATQIDFDHIEGIVRGDASLFVASHNDPRSQPALYSYTEVGNAPQYTALTPEVVQNVSFTMTLVPLDYSLPYPTDDWPPGDWFMYAKGGECHLVRPVVVGTTVTLAGDIRCGGIAGETPDGKTVLDISPPGLRQIYTLDGTTLTKVAEGSRLQYFTAAPVSPIILGWAGVDSSDKAFVCMASQPDRCWSAPDPLDIRLWGPIVPTQPDAVHVVYSTTVIGMLVFTSIRTFGPGNRAQPI